MQKNFTLIDKDKFTYEWIIKDFNDHLELLTNDRENYTLSSSSFPPSKDDKEQFFLKLRLHRQEKNKNTSAYGSYDTIYINWLTFHVQWKKPDKSENNTKRMKFQLYLLNDKQEKYKVMNFVTNANDQCAGSVEFIKTTDLTSKAELLPNDTLTLGCDLIVYEGSINVSPAYESKYNSSIKNLFEKFSKNHTSSDFTFSVDDQEFKAHKLLLMAYSPVFKAMFENEMTEKRTNQAVITDISPEIFEKLLKFIYTDEVEADLSWDEIVKLLEAADKYQIEALMDKYGELLFKRFEVKNVLDVYSVAEKYNIEKLICGVKNYIRVNEKEILNTIDDEYFIKHPSQANIFIFKK